MSRDPQARTCALEKSFRGLVSRDCYLSKACEPVKVVCTAPATAIKGRKLVPNEGGRRLGLDGCMQLRPGFTIEVHSTQTDVRSAIQIS